VSSGPIRNVFATSMLQRNRLGSGRASSPYLDEMVAIGMTDVIALPFVFTSGEVHAVAFATNREHGFSAGDVAAIEGVVHR